MPVHATRILPGSERITSNVPQLMATFDPAQPVHFEVGNQQLGFRVWVECWGLGVTLTPRAVMVPLGSVAAGF